MEINTFVKSAIGVIVAALVILSIVMPTVHTGTAETLVYENDGVYYAATDGENTHEIIISMDDDSNLSMTTDGEAVELPDFSLYSQATIVYGDKGLVRLGSTGGVQVYGASNQGSVSVTSAAPVTVTVGLTGATVTNGTTTKAAAFTPLAYINNDGEYKLCQNPRVTSDDSIIIIAGVTNYTGSDKIIYLANGTIDNLSVSTGYVTSADSLTVSDVSAVVNTSDVSGDLVKIDNVVFTATMSDNSELTGTYTYFLAPAEVEYNNPVYIDSTVTTIAGMLPVLMLVGVMLFVVGSFVTNRRA